jgi:hypothetical protein
MVFSIIMLCSFSARSAEKLHKKKNEYRSAEGPARHQRQL